MKKFSLVAALALLTTGCSSLLVPGRYSPGPLSYPAAGGIRPQGWSETLPIGRWDNVMRLPRTSAIDVLTRNGIPSVGGIIRADAESVSVDVGGTEVRIPRAEIVRIDLIELPGSNAGAVATSAARGALVGAGAMALFAGVLGGHAWPPPAALLRAGAASGGLSGASSALSRRQPRIVYLAPHQ